MHNYSAQTAQKVLALIRVGESYTKSDLIAKIQDGVPVEPKVNPNGPAPPLHMPAFKQMLTEAQMNDLVTYLMNLKPKGENLGF